MRAIIAGGRDYRFTDADKEWLDRFLALREPITEVISGGASGADAECERWAASHGIPVKRFPADWNAHGAAAGPIRNREMACYAGPRGICILFPGGRGTASMRREASHIGMNIFDRELIEKHSRTKGST